MRSKTHISVIAFIFSCISYGIAFLQFILRFESFHLPDRWLNQTVVLICLSLLTSVFLFFFQKKDIITFFLIILRLGIILVVGYPLGDNINVELTLLTSLIFDIGAYTKTAINIPISLSAISIVLLTQTKGYAWKTIISKVSLGNLLYMGFYPITIMIMISLMKYYQKVARDLKKIKDQLVKGSSKLVETNLQLQKYVLSKEDKAILKERKRLSREIHDIIGHTLMSIILMMKAAIGLADKKDSQLYTFLLHTKEQAQKGLNETRRALRVLRSTEIPKIPLITALNRLSKAFQETHIKIQIQYGNAPWSFSDRIDSIIYRVVQEGITNSVRHGDAKKIDIFLWYDKDVIQITINDDGKGCDNFSPGIGLSGIQERLNEFNGYYVTKSSYAGFKLHVYLPLKKQD